MILLSRRHAGSITQSASYATVSKATDARRGWREILAAAALQGAIYALVKAVIGRGTAEGTRKLTGVWPGKDGPQPEKAA
jgi:hypothetical protein